jgi:nucleotide-binding universal stress UspA family protein
MREDTVQQCERDIASLAVELAKDTGVPVEAVVRYAEPVLGILEYAEEWKADLIVMGTRGADATEHDWLGSVAENVAKRAPCPVLVTRADQTDSFPASGRFAHALVAVDYSKFSAPATHLAADLAEPESTLEMVHVYDFAGISDWDAYADAINDARQKELENLQEFAARLDLAAVRTSPRLQLGKIAEQLLEFANTSNTDVIIAGSHGSADQLEKLGTVADRLLHKAKVPVVLIPEGSI